MNDRTLQRMSIVLGTVAVWWCRRAAWLVLGASALAFAQTPALDGAAAPLSSSAPARPGVLDGLRNLFGAGSAEAELLPPDQAFTLAVRVRDANTMVATLTPAANYYLYRDRIAFSVADPPSVAIEHVALPKGEPKADPTFGTVEVYHRAVEAVISLRHAQPGVGELALRASYQGCNEPLGVCYPPIEKTVSVALSGPAVLGSTAPGPAAAVPASTTFDAWEAGRLRQLFSGSRWALIAAFFGFGVLLAFTPCMLPMIPILSGVIVGHGAQHDTPPRARAVDGVCAGDGHHLCAGRRRCRTGRHAAVGLAAEPLGAGQFRVDLRAARAVDVRSLRAAAAGSAADLAGQGQRPRARRQGGRRVCDGRDVGGDRRPLRGGAAGGRVALHRPDRRCGARRQRAVRDGAGHGRAAARRRCDHRLAAA